jgi:transposase
MWLSHSRRRFVMAFPSQKQESFFYGHVCAFEHFGGVPWRISYDNLSTAVRLMAEGKGRRENQTFVSFRSYYLFESHFCQPAAGWEKGGVEASVGFSRRNFMVPIPDVASFEDLNLHLLKACLKDDQRRVSREARDHWTDVGARTSASAQPSTFCLRLLRNGVCPTQRLQSGHLRN